MAPESPGWANNNASGPTTTWMGYQRSQRAKDDRSRLQRVGRVCRRAGRIGDNEVACIPHAISFPFFCRQGSVHLAYCSIFIGSSLPLPWYWWGSMLSTRRLVFFLFSSMGQCAPCTPPCFSSSPEALLLGHQHQNANEVSRAPPRPISLANHQMDSPPPAASPALMHPWTPAIKNDKRQMLVLTSTCEHPLSSMTNTGANERTPAVEGRLKKAPGH